MYIFEYKTSFYPKFVHFSEFFGENFTFRVKNTNFIGFSGPNVHFLGTKLQFLSKICTF